MEGKRRLTRRLRRAIVTAICITDIALKTYLEHMWRTTANFASVNSKTSYITPVFPRHCCRCHFSKCCRPHPSAGIVHAVRQALWSERNVTLRGSVTFITLSKASGDAEFIKSLAKVLHLNFANVFFYLHSRSGNLFLSTASLPVRF